MAEAHSTTPLRGIRVLSLASNVPGPVAAARLAQLGARITKVEPPSGDPLARFCPAWYRSLCRDLEVLCLDLKDPTQRLHLEPLLARSDLLLSATRPAALARLGLGARTLQGRHPHLSHVCILGFPPPQENRAGHDLTYQAAAGLLSPPALPLTLLADLAAAERVVSTALALLLARRRGEAAQSAQVALGDVAQEFALPLRHGLTTPGGPLGGGQPLYRLYEAAQGWIAVAALEPHFAARLQSELHLDSLEAEELEPVFRTRSAQEWQRWAQERDLPIEPVRELKHVPAPSGPAEP